MKNLKISLPSKHALILIALSVPLASQAETKLIAQATNIGNYQNNTGSPSQISQKTIDQKKSFGRKAWENTSLTYYQQFLGPTAEGSTSETYNIFQEGIDTPGSGRAPLQSFHGLNLRHQIKSNWAVGASLSAVNGYTKSVTNRDKNGLEFTNKPDSEFFNARAYVSLPSLETKVGTLFTTLSYEAPTSSISRNNDMRFGWVAAQSFSFKLPSLKWNAGVVGQAYRMYYKNNVQPALFSKEFGGREIPLQTTIISGGPYLNYRFNDSWMLGSVVTLDWDQRGEQADTNEFNNNLPHRGRVNLTYYPQAIKYLQTVGIFTQTLLKYRNKTTAFGIDFSFRF